jgi:DegV family protein with EDD domain
MTFANTYPLVEIDGRNLYYAFTAGAKKIIENQTELNKINVFPVNDGDTGSNLAGTVRSVLETLHPHRSYKITADRIAEASILNARGNSGIIFAQFLYGLSRETEDLKSVTLKQFADAIKKSVRYVYEAVAKPVEGTMLTVIRDLAEYIYGSWNKFSDFNQMFISSHEILSKSLSETRKQLDILEKNNVVDAGARGFVLFFEGIRDFINLRNIKELVQVRSVVSPIPREEEHTIENITFRYCTETVIRESSLNNPELIDILGKFGDSVVVAGSDEVKRVHIHTDNPSLLFDFLRKKGRITFQKADDMVRHNQIVTDRKWNIALVTDSACDLDHELFDRYQIHMVPININFGETQYLDKVTIQPEQFYSLLEETKNYPKTAQVNENTFTNLYSHLASHYDSVIAVHLSDNLSGTYFNSCKAAQKISMEFNKPISVFNSRNLSGSLGLIVLRIAQAIESGYSHDEIVSRAETWIRNSRIFVSVKTLKYMVRGGRVSHTKGLIAKILNINPIVSLDESGKAIVFDKTFSQQANMQKVMEHIRALTKEKNIWNYIVLHANNPESAEWFSSGMEKLSGKKPVSVVNISPVIGANAGIGAASVALLFD